MDKLLRDDFWVGSDRVARVAGGRHVAQEPKRGGVKTGRVPVAPQNNNLLDFKAQRRVEVSERAAHI